MQSVPEVQIDMTVFAFSSMDKRILGGGVAVESPLIKGSIVAQSDEIFLVSFGRHSFEGDPLKGNRGALEHPWKLLDNGNDENAIVVVGEASIKERSAFERSIVSTILERFV